jgi:hypothetical protein
MKNTCLRLSGTLAARITFLSDGELGALALREADPWLWPRPNDKDVGQSKHHQYMRLRIHNKDQRS